MKSIASPLSRPARWALLGSLVLKFALIGAVYPRNHGAVLLFDSGSYLRPAQALLSLGKFSLSPSQPSVPEIVRTPGYPALIAGVYAIAGERLWLLAVVNALLVAGTGVLVYRLTASIAGATAGTAAVVLYCLEPSTFHYGTVVMSEIPFTFCLALALWFLHRVLLERRLLPTVGAGALLGIATLVRPILTFAILPVVVTAGALLLLAHAGFRRTLLLAAVFAGSTLVVITPWQVRNRKLTGDGSLSQVKNVVPYFFDAAAVVADIGHESVRTVQERFGLYEFAYRFGFVATEAEAFGGRRYAELYPSSSRLSLIALAHSYRDRARSILQQHPWAALVARARGLWLLLWVPNTISWAYHYGWFDAYGEFTRQWVYPRPLSAMIYLAHTDGWLVLVSVLFLVPVMAIYLFALKGLRVSTGDFRILLLVVLGYMLIVSGVPGYPDDRLRVPLVPILCVFAGIGLADALRARLRGSPG
jgi:hypothetical protein